MIRGQRVDDERRSKHDGSVSSDGENGWQMLDLECVRMRFRDLNRSIPGCKVGEDSITMVAVERLNDR